MKLALLIIGSIVAVNSALAAEPPMRSPAANVAVNKAALAPQPDYQALYQKEVEKPGSCRGRCRR